jgi:arylsulfatase
MLTFAIVIALSILLGTNLLAETATSEKPNVVLFFIDDMGFGDIGPNGNEANQTPHLDRMAKEGIRFTSFYTSNQNCTPSRAALLTGCYADRVGMDGSVVNVRDRRGLNPKEVSIAKMLKSAGYTTGCLGKWHLGDQQEFLPLNHGFDEFEGIPYSNDMWSGKKARKSRHCPI